MMKIHTDNLRPTDVVIKKDDNGRIVDTCSLKLEVPTLGCTGRHFITIANQVVCYGRGTVLIQRSHNGS
jgi:hypothetical protein